jgi:hypothetical protein
MLANADVVDDDAVVALLSATTAAYSCANRSTGRVSVGRADLCALLATCRRCTLVDCGCLERPSTTISAARFRPLRQADGYGARYLEQQLLALTGREMSVAVAQMLGMSAFAWPQPSTGHVFSVLRRFTSSRSRRSVHARLAERRRSRLGCRRRDVLRERQACRTDAGGLWHLIRRLVDERRGVAAIRRRFVQRTTRRSRRCRRLTTTRRDADRSRRRRHRRCRFADQISSATPVALRLRYLHTNKCEIASTVMKVRLAGRSVTCACDNVV